MPQAQRGQQRDHRRAASGTCQLRHQHDRHQPAQHAPGRLRNPSYGRREQRDGLHGVGNGEGAAGRAGRDHAARIDHRFQVILILCGIFRPSLLTTNGQYLVYSPSVLIFGQAESCSPTIKITNVPQDKVQYV